MKRGGVHEYRRYERLGGNRPGRNVCISGRITDDMDDKVDIIVEKGDTTRSKIVSDAVETYVKKQYHMDTTAIAQKGTTTRTALQSVNKTNTDSTLLTIIIERDTEGMYIGIVPTLEGCYTCGKTLDEVLENLQKAINGNLPSL